MIPPLAELGGSVVLTHWLSQHLSTPTIDADEVTLECSARGFILALLGSFIFVDKKGLHVHLCFLPYYKIWHRHLLTIGVVQSNTLILGVMSSELRWCY